MTTAEIYDLPEFQELLEIMAKRSADLRITLEANKQWAASLQKEIESE